MKLCLNRFPYLGLADCFGGYIEYVLWAFPLVVFSSDLFEERIFQNPLSRLSFYVNFAGNRTARSLGKFGFLNSLYFLIRENLLKNFKFLHFQKFK